MNARTSAKFVIAIEKDGTQIGRQEIDLATVLTLPDKDIPELLVGMAGLVLIQSAAALEIHERTDPDRRPPV
jgi:hypothetical protein